MEKKVLRLFMNLLIALTLILSFMVGNSFVGKLSVVSAEGTSASVSTLEEFQTAIADSDISVITLTSNITLPTGTYDCGNKQILTSGYHFTIASEETVHLNNADIDMGGNSAFQNSGVFYGDNIDVHSGNIVFVYGSSSSNTYIIVSNSRFHDNRNSQQTFARTSGTMVIDNCSFYNNVNTAGNNDGAIIETNSGGMVYIYRTTFTNNCGYAHAGCINDYGGYLYIADTIFTGNTIKEDSSSYSGGGIRGSSGLQMMISTVLAYNKYADGAKDGDIGSMPNNKNVNNVIGYIGGTATGVETSQYFSEFEVTGVGNGTSEGIVSFNHPKIDANGNVSVSTSALNELWNVTHAQLDYSDLSDIKLTYYNPTTGEDVVIGSSWAVNYYYNDGTDNVIIDNVSKLSSSSYRLSDGPIRTDYRFLGWYDNSSLTGTPRAAGSYYYNVQEGTAFYAGWIKSGMLITDSTQSVSQLTITSEINDHQSNFYSVNRGNVVTITSKTRLMFSCGGFAESKSDDTYIYTGTVSDDITVSTAYTMTFESNGGTEIDDVTVQYGESISLDSYVPDKTCYSFLGWYNEMLTTRYTYTYVYNDVTYYAKWGENHDWNYTYEWDTTHTVCTEHRVCQNDESHTKDVIYTKHEAVAATCTEDGTIEYYSCDADSNYYTLIGENSFTMVNSIIEAATGHDWDVPTYVWTDNNLTCTRTYICKNDSSHKKTDTVDTTSEIDGEDTVFTANFSNQETKYSHTSNINDSGESSGNYDNNSNSNEVITIEGADSLHVILTYQTESISYDWVSVWEGNHPEYTAYSNCSSGIKVSGNTTGKYGGSGKTTVEFDVSGDSVTFGFRSDGSVNDYYGYHAEVTGGTDDIQTKREPTDSVITAYKITFDSAGASSVESQFVVSGEFAEEPDDLLKEGCRFEGWYNEGSKFDFSTPITKDTILTAKWTELTYNPAVVPTCTEAGVVEYWTDGVKYYSDAYGKNEIESIAGEAALGHAYGTPVWSWVGYDSANATFTCEHDVGHKEIIEAAITSKITQAATVNEEGNRIYTAKVSFEGRDYTDTKEETLDKIAVTHIEAVSPTYTTTGNSEYYKGADGKYYTLDNGEYKEIEADSWMIATLSLTRVEEKGATCTEVGNKEYWYDEINDKYFSDEEGTEEIGSNEVVISALGHAYGTPVWSWVGYDSAKATFTCERDAEHKKIVEAEITSEITQTATVNAEGKRLYTAKVIFEGLEYTDIKEEILDKIAVTYIEAVAPSYVSEGNSEYYKGADGKYYILDNGEYKEIKEGTWIIDKNLLTHVEEAPATCTEEGNKEYWYDEINDKYFSNADGTNEIEADEAVIPALGHSYGEPVWSWDGYGSAKVTFTCERDAEHKKIVEAEITSEITQVATVNAVGKRLYTAKVTFEGRDYTDTKEEILDKTAVTHIEAVAPTYTTTGNSDYYEGADGKYYILDNGEYKEIEADSWMLPRLSNETKIISNEDGTETTVVSERLDNGEMIETETTVVTDAESGVVTTTEKVTEKDPEGEVLGSTIKETIVEKDDSTNTVKTTETVVNMDADDNKTDSKLTETVETPSRISKTETVMDNEDVVIEKTNSITNKETSISSILKKVGAEVANVAVEQLSDEAESRGENESKVTLVMTVKQEEETNVADDVKNEVNEATPNDTAVDYLDITVMKETDKGTEDKAVELISETNRVLEIKVPYDMAGKKNITVYRHHEGELAAFTELEELPESGYADGRFYVDYENEIIYIYTQKFSTYMIGYIEKSADNASDDKLAEEIEGEEETPVTPVGDKDGSPASDDDKSEVTKQSGTKTDESKNNEKSITPVSADPRQQGVTQEEKIEITMNAGLKISQTDTKINIEWGKVKEADGYEVYVAYCGKDFHIRPLLIDKNTRTKVKVTEINGKKINLKKNFKVYVAAYKLADGKRVRLARTITGHVVGRKNTRYSNAKKISISKNKYSIKVGKTKKIKAKTVLVDKNKRQLSDAHTKEFRYASSNKKIAAVDKTGQIKGIAKGTCTIYVYARNGYAKKIKVTVK